jgi:hypothetical protein
MKIKTTLSKILNQDFFPTLRRVMSKWPEARDIHCLVKIAGSVEEEQRVYQKTVEAWTEANGYQLKDSHKTVSAEEVTDHLLKEFGRFDSTSKLSMAGASEEDKDAFLEEKHKADSIFKKYSKDMNELLEKEFELDIPRLVKVDGKYIRKEIISASDCFTLLPILDLSGVSDPEAEKDKEEE